jgi:nitrogenase subunit NifH
MRLWIKQNIVLIIIVCAFLIIVPPIIINTMYLVGSDEPNTMYSANDLISYVGTVLSFIGMIILGVVAITQTESANELSQKLLELEKGKDFCSIIPTKDIMHLQSEKSDIKIVWSAHHNMITVQLYCMTSI